MDGGNIMVHYLKNNTLCQIHCNFSEQILLRFFVLVKKSFSHIPLGLTFEENIGKTYCVVQKKVVYTPLQTSFSSKDSELVNLHNLSSCMAK